MPPKIITFRTTSHEGLYSNHFLPSLLRHEPDASVENHLLSVDSDGSFLSAGFQKTIFLRLIGQLRAMENCTPEDILLSMDVDIVILRPFLADVQERMDQNHLDILYQSESPNGGLNAGLFAFRCNSPVRDFLYKVLVTTLGNPVGLLEQQTMNELLPRSGLTHGLLPPALYPNGGNGGLCESSLLYHATSTMPRDGKTSLELKVEAFHAVMNNEGR